MGKETGMKETVDNVLDDICRKAGCGIGKSRAGEQRNKPQEGI